MASEEPLSAKEAQAITQKQSVAAHAASLIRAGGFVFIDAGSTTLQMVKYLSGQARSQGCGATISQKSFWV